MANDRSLQPGVASAWQGGAAAPVLRASCWLNPGRLAHVLVVVSLATVACHEEAPAPFVGDVSRSQYFEYHDQVNESLCPDLLSLLDKHAEMIGGLVGLSLNPDAPPFRYYRYESLEGYIEDFPGSGGLCIGDSVYSFNYFEPHELVHAYVYRAWGDWPSNGLLREGIAVALSCDPMDSLALASYDWRDLLHVHADSDAGYALGACCGLKAQSLPAGPRRDRPGLAGHC